MKRLIVAIFLLMFAIPSLAGGMSYDQMHSAGWDKLSESQKAALVKQVADTTAQQSNLTNPQNVEQWVNIGERLGKVIGSVAKEVGVAVNEFITTPVGQMTMALIIWSYMGTVLVHIIGGVLILIVGFTFITYIMRRVVSQTTVYNTERTNVFGNHPVLKVERAQLSSDSTIGFTICGAVVIGVSLLTAFSF